MASTRWTEHDEDMRKLIRPMTPAEREEHERGYSRHPLRLDYNNLPRQVGSVPRNAALAFGLRRNERSGS